MNFAPDAYINLEEKVGTRIAGLRINLGLKQHTVETMTDMTHQRLSNIERGKYGATYRELMALSTVLDTDPIYLLSGIKFDIPQFAETAYTHSTDIERAQCWIAFAKEFERLHETK